MSKTRFALILLALANLVIIIALIFVKSNAETHLERAAKHLEDLGNEKIQHTVNVNTTIPIQASIPIDQTVDISFNDPMRVQSIIGVDIPVRETLDVAFEILVPMDQNILLHLPLRTTAQVKFMEPLKDTPIKKSMGNVAKELRELFPF